MDGNKLEVNGNLYGVGVAQDGSVVNQNIILPEHTIPKQLTSKLGKDTIIGRVKELEEIDTLLKESSSLLLINGIGGIGKSTIASYYLHSQKENLDYYGFFEGLDSFTAELREPLELKQEKENDAFMEALSKLRKLEGNKLLVFDDVKDIDDNQDKIGRILALKDSGYKILLTSREEIEDVGQYYLDVLSLIDAKELFNSIYSVEDEILLEKILGYLDCHAFFVEMTAKTLKSKKTLTPKIIKEKFENGEFSTIKRKRKESFNDYLNELFSFDKLDNEEILMLKQFSVLPAIEINFENLQYFLQKEEIEEFEELLDYLSEKGWLSKIKKGYKLHQIIKEYLLYNHTPNFIEIETIVDILNKALLEINTDVKIIIDNRDSIVYFESMVFVLKILNLKNETIGTFYNNFGTTYYHLGNYKNSESLYLKALKVREDLFGEEHLDTALSYNNLAGLYVNIGMYKKAKYLGIKALKIREKLLGKEHYDTATSYSTLAEIYKLMREYGKAKSLYFRAIEIYEKVLGKEHLFTAQSYNNLAELYQLREYYKKAESLFSKSLMIYEKVLGKEHPSTATLYNNLAVLYKLMGIYEKADILFNKALKIYKKVLGKEHPITLKSYKNLIELYKRKGEFEKIELLHNEFLKN